MKLFFTAIIFLATLTALAADSPDTTSAQPAADTVYFKAGMWVQIPATPDTVTAFGTATVVTGSRNDIQYALPMSSLWQDGGSYSGVSRTAWLVAELARNPAMHGAVRDGILKSLPTGSQLVSVGDIRAGVPESLDLIVCYGYSEGLLQPQEQAALTNFVRMGGSVLFIFSSPIPAASVDLWRDLLGAFGAPERQHPNLPPGLLVPNDFAMSIDIPDAGDAESRALPRLAWKRFGRGVVMAYGLAPNEPILTDAELTARLFERVVLHARNTRRPVNLRPIDPEMMQLFDETTLTGDPRRNFAVAAAGYSIGAIALMLAAGVVIRKNRAFWIAGVALISLAGAGVIAAVIPQSGLMLDAASILIDEPGTEPVIVVIGKISRFAPGAPPELASVSQEMPPKLVLYAPYSASQKIWMNYRFQMTRSTSEPLLDKEQYLYVATVRAVPKTVLDAAKSMLQHDEPPYGSRLVNLFRSRWSEPGAEYTYRWVTPLQASRLFSPDSAGEFLQVTRGPMLIASRNK